MISCSQYKFLPHHNFCWWTLFYELAAVSLSWKSYALYIDTAQWIGYSLQVLYRLAFIKSESWPNRILAFFCLCVVIIWIWYRTELSKWKRHHLQSTGVFLCLRNKLYKSYKKKVICQWGRFDRSGGLGKSFKMFEISTGGLHALGQRGLQPPCFFSSNMPSLLNTGSWCTVLHILF